METHIANKNIVVIGLGMTGLSVVNYLVKSQARENIKVIDTRNNAPGGEDLPSGVSLYTGGWQMDWLLNADLIVASPGVALASPELIQAQQRGIEIIGDIELFARAVNVPVIGITGSNGKSTVTTLLGEMAKAAGVDVGVGGNIGVPALDLLAENHALYVLELSSFQLETTSSLAMAAATVLNFSEDHMDRYASLSDYLAAKQRIYHQTHFAVFNHEDKATEPHNAVKRTSFGDSDSPYCTRDFAEGEYLVVDDRPVMPVSDIGLVGRHNVQNCLAAMALADAVGIPQKAQIEAISSYQGLSHRCQKVLEHNGVVWINDSKATNPASTLAAIDGLSIEGTLHLLLGGDGKGADFSSLQPAIEKMSVHLYCYGRDKQALAQLSPHSLQTSTLFEAMSLANEAAKVGDIILLSPACASLDQFSNFMERGDAFVAFAHQLTAQVEAKGNKGNIHV